MGKGSLFSVGWLHGYRRTYAVVNRTFNVVTAALLLLLSLPVFLLLALVIYCVDGRPVFYSGPRLGQNKRVFTMFKFRTLVRDANKILGSELVSSRHKVQIPGGSFLRDTRLDELPQLWNVLRGDMDLVGPRPERPEVYEAICRHIPGYDKRFVVKPGLVGFSQLFTPHGAPKPLRTVIDNHLIRQKQRLLGDLYVVAYAGIVLIFSVLTGLARKLALEFVPQKLLRRYRQKRDQRRVRPKDAQVWLDRDGRHVAQLVDINEHAFLMRSPQALPTPLPERFRLQIEVPYRTRPRKRKVALCKGKLYRDTRTGDGSHEYVVEYEPVSPLNYYMIQQYFLQMSVA